MTALSAERVWREVSTIETDAFLLTERAINDVLAHSALAAVVGPAGTGKTHAVKVISRALQGVRVLAVEFESRPTMLHVARTLMRTLSGSEPRGNRHRLSVELVAALQPPERQRLLLHVDEAQRLNRECIEYLRYLHDHVQTGFALCLSGGDGCWDVIEREPMLLSRIFRRVRFSPLTDNQVLEFMPRYHPLWGECPPELLLEVNERCAHGVFRTWALLTETVLDLMKERVQRHPSDSTIRLAIELVAGG
jgi:DNA transposition AAA+ family ATPase